MTALEDVDPCECQDDDDRNAERRYLSSGTLKKTAVALFALYGHLVVLAQLVWLASTASGFGIGRAELPAFQKECSMRTSLFECCGHA